MASNEDYARKFTPAEEDVDQEDNTRSSARSHNRLINDVVISSNHKSDVSNKHILSLNVPVNTDVARDIAMRCLNNSGDINGVENQGIEGNEIITDLNKTGTLLINVGENYFSEGPVEEDRTTKWKFIPTSSEAIEITYDERSFLYVKGCVQPVKSRSELHTENMMGTRKINEESFQDTITRYSNTDIEFFHSRAGSAAMKNRQLLFTSKFISKYSRKEQVKINEDRYVNSEPSGSGINNMNIETVMKRLPPKRKDISSGKSQITANRSTQMKKTFKKSSNHSVSSSSGRKKKVVSKMLDNSFKKILKSADDQSTILTKYTCSNCDFSSAKVNNLIFHMKYCAYKHSNNMKCSEACKSTNEQQMHDGLSASSLIYDDEGALQVTGNRGVEPAMEWLLAGSDANEPIPQHTFTDGKKDEDLKKRRKKYVASGNNLRNIPKQHDANNIRISQPGSSHQSSSPTPY